MVNIIVAVGKYVEGKGYPIGKDGRMPWNNADDLKWFREKTMGSVVIMGRRTYEAIGKPLDGRENIVVSRTMGDTEGVYVINSLDSALEYANTYYPDHEVFIIGGAKLYNEALERGFVDKVYMDCLDYEVPDADTFFNFTGPKVFKSVFSRVVGDHCSSITYDLVERVIDNNVDEQYLAVAKRILEEGVVKHTRAGDTRSIFGVQMRFDLKKGLPLLTTKKVFTKGCIHELLWFLKGDTNIKYLVDNGVHIWDNDAYRHYRDLIKMNNALVKKNTRINYFERKQHEILTLKDFLREVINGTKIHLVECEDFWKHSYVPNECEYDYTFGDLGPVYGQQWRNWEGVDQIRNVIDALKTNPDDRRLLVSAWNVSEIPDMALPPCHYSFQFYTKKLTHEERVELLAEKEPVLNVLDTSEEVLDKYNVPKHKLSCMFQMRSSDFGCGVPFNWLSYAILTHIIAQCVNMEVDELIYTVGDAHIYENQINGIKEQLSRNPYAYGLAKLELNEEIKDIDDFTYDDIKITGYESYPSIKLPLSTGL